MFNRSVPISRVWYNSHFRNRCAQGDRRSQGTRFLGPIGVWHNPHSCSTVVQHESKGYLAIRTPTIVWRASNQDVDTDALYALIERERRPIRRARQQIGCRKVNTAGEITCNWCGEFKSLSCFNRCSGSSYGIQSSCRECMRKRSHDYRRTLRGTVRQLVSSARARSKHPRKSGPTLVHDDIFDMLWRQKGLCYYSGVVLECILPHSHWRISLERLDNTIGYSKSNCVLIAGEFNTSDNNWRIDSDGRRQGTGSCKWSIAKVNAVAKKRAEHIDTNALASLIQVARQTPSFQRKSGGPRQPDSRGYWRCSRCTIYKPRESFYARANSRPDSWCKACRKEATSKYFQTLRGNAKALVSTARAHDRKKGWQRTLSSDDVLDMLMVQEGRCYYSGVPIEHSKTKSDWRMSLERLDNTKGHHKDNCVLIALEFNTGDYSRCPGALDVHGTAQWSRAKVAHIWGHYWDSLP